MRLITLSFYQVSDALKKSPKGPYQKELKSLGNDVEEYATQLIKYPMNEWRSKPYFDECINRIAYSVIHYKCKKVCVSYTQFYSNISSQDFRQSCF